MIEPRNSIGVCATPFALPEFHFRGGLGSPFRSSAADWVLYLEEVGKDGSMRAGTGFSSGGRNKVLIAYLIFRKFMYMLSGGAWASAHKAVVLVALKQPVTHLRTEFQNVFIC